MHMRSIFGRLFACLIVLLMARAGWCAAARAEAPAPRAADGRIAIVQLGGDPQQIGAEHGRALRPQIQFLHEHYLKAIFAVQPAFYRMAVAAASLYRAKLPEEYAAELAALSQSSGIDAQESMLGQCFLDLGPNLSCSTIALPADAAPDGVARFGRNLDFPGLGVADKTAVVMVVKPRGQYAFAAVTWPGLIGVLSGMNEHGLTLANMEVRRPPRWPQAMPYTLLYRTVLERCRTVDEAVALLEKTPRQTANNLMLMDATGARAVVEIQPEKIVVRRGREHEALVSTNHQRGQDYEGAGRCRRYDLLHERAGASFGKIDVPALEKMLAGASQGRMTIQSMVFEPANRVIYLATGERAATRGFEKVELKGLLQK